MDTTIQYFGMQLSMCDGVVPLRDEKEEARWIARAKCGDHAAYRWLLDRYRNRAVRVAAHVLRREGDAEDIAQEAFLQAFRRLSSLRGSERFGPWLYKIVVRLCLNQMRSKRWSSEFSLDTMEASLQSFQAYNVDQRVVVEALLEKLSPPMRAALVLRELEGLEYEEIAAVLEIPVGTVRSRLNAARSHFRALWEALEDEDAKSR